MGKTHTAPLFAPGGFYYLPGVFQYSAGVAAAEGYRIERARFDRPVPLTEAFDRAQTHLAALDRPTEAFCACELRSPAPFTEAGFLAFNRIYAGTLGH
ncbi:MAG: 2-amino-5-chloromuconate deaminase CnbZ, partial [Thermomicrobiales bacterium]